MKILKRSLRVSGAFLAYAMAGIFSIPVMIGIFIIGGSGFDIIAVLMIAVGLALMLFFFGISDRLVKKPPPEGDD